MYYPPDAAAPQFVPGSVLSVQTPKAAVLIYVCSAI